MTRYAPRLQVRIEHAYYAGGRARGLRFSPDAQTADWLRTNDAVCRDTGDGLDVSAPPQTAAETGIMLCWWAHGSDALWRNVTDHLGSDLQRLPCLRPARAAQPGGDAEALHAKPCVMPEDLWPLDLPGTLAGLAEDQPLPRRPLFVLRLPAPGLQDSPMPAASYRAAFAARALHWQYRLMGNWPGPGLHVEDVSPGLLDPARALAFEAPAERPLASGVKVTTIRSQDRIALQERPEHRLQLRSRTPAADRVLVKRLPMAGADHFVRETIDGEPTLVSEIFVHR